VICSIILVFMLSFTALHADHFTHLFENGNEAYEQTHYEEAIQYYEEILANDYESWEVYFNLGNAYYKQINIGKAILNYEKAKRLQPDNEDIQYNLELANLRVIDKIQTPPQFFLIDFFETVRDYFSIDGISLITLFSYITVMSLIMVVIVFKVGSFGRLLRSLIYFVSLLLILASIVLYAKIHEVNHTDYGIILVPKVNVYSSPDENGTEIFSLHEGAKVQLKNDTESWSQIRLSDGKTGWIKNETFDVI